MNLFWIILAAICICSLCLFIVQTIMGFYLINRLEVDFLDLYKTSNLIQFIENKLVEKNILIQYSARNIVEKIPEENFEQGQQKNEIIAEIDKTIEEIGKTNSLENTPFKIRILGNTQEAPETIRTEIDKFLKKQKQFRIMLWIFNFVFN